MKKSLFLIMALIVALNSAGCGQKEKKTTEKNSSKVVFSVGGYAGKESIEDYTVPTPQLSSQPAPVTTASSNKTVQPKTPAKQSTAAGKIVSINGNQVSIYFLATKSNVNFYYDSNTNFNKLSVDRLGSPADLKAGLNIVVFMKDNYAAKIQYFTFSDPYTGLSGENIYEGVLKTINGEQVTMTLKYNRDYTFAADVSPEKPIIYNAIYYDDLSIQLNQSGNFGTLDNLHPGMSVRVFCYDNRAYFIGLLPTEWQ